MKITDIDRVYVVNLDRRPDRWDRIQKDWADTGVELPLTRYTACDGQVFLPPRSWDVGNAAFGCYLSHVSIMIEMARLGIEHALILEDDAVFAPDFRDRLTATLADMPAMYDQLYLGYQLLNQDRIKPTRITDNLGRASNCNRNHAILYSRRGAVRILHRLLELKDRQPKHHIDHWLGRLHEELDGNKLHTYDVFISIPTIVYQGAGKSDISGKDNQVNKWLYTGEYLKEDPAIVEILDYKTSYGAVGKGSSLGYEGRLIDLPPGVQAGTTISLHAPAVATVATHKPLVVVGAMNGSGGPGCDVICLVDDVEIGRIRKSKSVSKAVRLDAGKHKLEFRLDGKNNALAHSVWSFAMTRPS